MTNTPLLRSKFRLPPLPLRAIERSPLIAQIDEALYLEGKRLVLVCAHAGTGKTTLLAHWIARNPHPVAWLTLDVDDNDPTLFLRYLLAAIQEIWPRGDAMNALVIEHTAPRSALTLLLNELSQAEEPLTLVLDDYHLISEQQVHELLNYLIDYLPAHCHVILATRSDPPLPLARLRARNAMLELRARQLQFSLDEAAHFLSAALPNRLTPQQVETLVNRTEGWIAGLQLVALSLHGRDNAPAFVDDFAGSNLYILDYLTDEVLHRQTPEMRRFLLESALLNRLSAPLCDAVALRSDSLPMIEAAYRENLFITPLDMEGRWFRYHPLFASLLRGQMKQHYSQQQISDLLERASRWHEEQGDMAEAVDYALAMPHKGRALSLIEAQGRSLIAGGQFTLLRRWLAGLAPSERAARPLLVLFEGWVNMFAGEYETSFERFARVRDTLDLGEPQQRGIYGEMSALLATSQAVRGDTAEALRLADEALDLLPPEQMALRARALSARAYAYGFDGQLRATTPHIWEAMELSIRSGNRVSEAYLRWLAAYGLWHMARLDESAGMFQQIIEMNQPEAGRPFDLAAIGCLGRALIEIEWNRLDQAGQYLALAQPLVAASGWLEADAAMHTSLARLALYRGDYEAALAEMALLRARPRTQRYDLFWDDATFRAAHIHLWAGDIDGAQYWVRETEGKRLPVLFEELRQIMLAHLALTQGEYQQVLAIREAVRDSALAGERFARVIDIDALGAVALAEQGLREQAAATLLEGLHISLGGGHIRVYLDAGERLTALLPMLEVDADSPALRDYVERLMLQAQPAMATSSGGKGGQVESLSERELEVLRLIMAGFSNKEIALKLSVSLDTVKKHSTHLYGKLGVSSRTQAILKAGELGLL